MIVGLSTFFATYGSKIIAGAVILLIRYVEKSKIVKHYKQKLDKVLKISDDEENNN
jgi:hypothetical protein